MSKRNGASANGKQTPEYHAYYNARTRCTNPHVEKYEIYGARGIEFRFASFPEFLAEVGRKPSPQHVLDRIDVDGHYEAGNVRWITPTGSCFNQRVRKDNTSGHKGLKFVARMRRRPWRSVVHLNGKDIHLGYFATREEAAVAHEDAVQKLFGG
jgi:hypothetical protein